MRARRLVLTKETLHELSPDELLGIVGARIPTWYSGCVTTVYPSILDDCLRGG